MKHTLTLAAWNFRLARRSLLALWGIFAAQQLALVVFRICWQGAAGMGLASHYYVTMQIFAYLGFYLLTGLAAGLATHNSRRARSGYTWATLPGTPGQKFGAKAITIAEDMSGMPGMCLPIADGGIGFDYRLGMGLPDMWIKAVKGQDEFWDINQMWGSMCLRRPGEKTVAYVESHDQALVGDQTMIFRLAGANMYTDMNKDCHNPVIDRAIALHKMIRLFTLSGGGEAYLNFMGNEFGHPEWIDFPREGNGWSFHYCRRQWSLKDNGMLKYQWLGDFDEDMVHLTKENRIFDQRMADLLLMKAPEQTLAYYRHGLVFVFNFHFGNSLNNVLVPVRRPGEYTVVLSTDDEKYGGFGNVAKKTYATKRFDGRDYIELYIPARTGFVLKEKVILPKTPAALKKVAK